MHVNLLKLFKVKLFLMLINYAYSLLMFLRAQTEKNINFYLSWLCHNLYAIPYSFGS